MQHVFLAECGTWKKNILKFKRDVHSEVQADSHRSVTSIVCLAVKVKRLQRRWCPLEWSAPAILGEAVESVIWELDKSDNQKVG